MDFEALLPGVEDMSGPSWARTDWPLPSGDDLTRALDAADMVITAPGKVAGKAVAIAAAAGASPDAIARAHDAPDDGRLPQSVRAGGAAVVPWHRGRRGRVPRGDRGLPAAAVFGPGANGGLGPLLGGHRRPSPGALHVEGARCPRRQGQGPLWHPRLAARDDGVAAPQGRHRIRCRWCCPRPCSSPHPSTTR